MDEQGKIIYPKPKYDLSEMFTDKTYNEYKVNCKYDFYFQGDEQLGPCRDYRISSRNTNQVTLLDSAKSPRSNGLVNMDAQEVSREKVWNFLCKNLFEFPIPPQDFFTLKFNEKFCPPTHRLAGVVNNPKRKKGEKIIYIQT